MEQLMDYCIQIGVDVNAINIAGDHALILACKLGNLETVQKVRK
jgi:ankyrin repeat protein